MHRGGTIALDWLLSSDGKLQIYNLELHAVMYDSCEVS